MKRTDLTFQLFLGLVFWYLCNAMTTYLCTKAFWTLINSVVLGATGAGSGSMLPLHEEGDPPQGMKPKAQVSTQKQPSSPDTELGKDWQTHCCDLSMFPWLYRKLYTWHYKFQSLLLLWSFWKFFFVLLVCVFNWSLAASKLSRAAGTLVKFGAGV